ncbi:hypothetical protein ER308_14740 [Egibacter rhizosphaerae]|uniref:Sulfotransferase domain-containing protein n=1 Tax=Egibacter rhizosphaerae TaxID=1670831 RepID=A0A411YHZ3_9ACTN|nr:sulfotransferase [Egibacter rhizosphaerae]QBI20692.1 hypothetical protein ER308_14740 [Egibacter rhizosphaerae]
MAAPDPRQLPTFVIIGAMKSGTQSLHHYLGAHPDVFVTQPKEPNFFNLNEPSEQALADYGARWFAGGEDAIARGEGSVNYTKRHRQGASAERLARALPHVRLVMLMRDPVDRIRSHYRHGVAAGRIREPIADALAASDNMVLTSLYAWQLEPYLERFPRSQIHLATAERLRAEPDAVVGELCRFVGVDPARAPAVEGERHRSDEKPSPDLFTEPGRFRRARPIDTSGELPRRVARRVRRRLLPDVRRVRELLGDEVDAWRLV